MKTKKTIALLLIATNKYIDFVKPLLESVEPSPRADAAPSIE
jgi:hypothetical protein